MSVNELMENWGFQARFQAIDKPEPDSLSDYLDTLEEKWKVSSPLAGEPETEEPEVEEC